MSGPFAVSPLPRFFLPYSLQPEAYSLFFSSLRFSDSPILFSPVPFSSQYFPYFSLSFPCKPLTKALYVYYGSVRLIDLSGRGGAERGAVTRAQGRRRCKEEPVQPVGRTSEAWRLVPTLGLTAAACATQTGRLMRTLL